MLSMEGAMNLIYRLLPHLVLLAALLPTLLVIAAALASVIPAA